MNFRVLLFLSSCSDTPTLLKNSSSCESTESSWRPFILAFHPMCARCLENFKGSSVSYVYRDQSSRDCRRQPEVRRLTDIGSRQFFLGVFLILLFRFVHRAAGDAAINADARRRAVHHAYVRRRREAERRRTARTLSRQRHEAILCFLLHPRISLLATLPIGVELSQKCIPSDWKNTWNLFKKSNIFFRMNSFFKL